jgi:hypothetical protein
VACGVLTLPISKEIFVLLDPVFDARTKLVGGPLVTNNCGLGIELVARPMRTGDRSQQVSTAHEPCRLLEQLIDVRVRAKIFGVHG